jgi:septal ring factor EnvC (AmiA/AmiB activator)
MSTPLVGISESKLSRNSNTTPKRQKSYLPLILVWFFLVSSGLTGAYYYTNYLKKELTADLAQQNQAQLLKIQTNYEQQLSRLETNVNQEMTDLQNKVEQLNQLLAFAKDSTSSKTDSSNQLYTQLQDVKKQLEQLQKNMDVLK